MYYLLLFHRNNGRTNASQCYVTIHFPFCAFNIRLAVQVKWWIHRVGIQFRSPRLVWHWSTKLFPDPFRGKSGVMKWVGNKESNFFCVCWCRTADLWIIQRYCSDLRSDTWCGRKRLVSACGNREYYMMMMMVHVPLRYRTGKCRFIDQFNR